MRAMQVEELGKRHSATLLQRCDPLAERRDNPRYSVDEDSVLLFMGQGKIMPGSVVDLSQDGCCIRTKERCSLRVQWPLEVAFKINGVPFQFSGILQWTNGRDLLGIHFVNMLPRRMVELANVICGMEAAAASKAGAVNMVAAREEAPVLVERKISPLAEGTNSAVNSAEAIDLPVHPQPAAPLRHAETAPPTAPTSTPRNRRTTVRHEVDTSATIFLVHVGSTLRGRILDLSLSGCRIRTDERFHVGIYTRVETEFRLEGLPFRLGGVIQAIHDRNNVGIRFLDLSQRKREQVNGLITEIEELRAAQGPAQPVPAPDSISM
jgi:hypothetical protein